MKKILFELVFLCFFTSNILAQQTAGLQISTENGIVEGLENSGIREFKGVPFAAPPVGELRWKEPQPVKNWSDVLETKKFAPKAMQLAAFGDMNSRSEGMSEDCLYLNIWTPAKSATEKLPVLVYYYGGGFVAGDGSEPRYDGESFARKGVIVVTVNYRLGVFGFLSHPVLTKESVHKASGNYGLLDQAAALKWVKRNIVAFGGNPEKVTIGGESAGSISVSIQMISPLTKNLIAGAIGESGSIMRMMLSAVPLANAEKEGVKFLENTGVASIAELRKMPAEELLKLNSSRFPIAIDGYLIPQSPEKIFTAGQQAHVPLLVGWNSQEMAPEFLMGKETMNSENFNKKVNELYGPDATAVLELYKANTDAEVVQAATDLASDRFIVFSTWKWADLQAHTGVAPVYRYYFARPRPDMRSEMGNAVAGLAGGVSKDASTPKPPKPLGAVHSAELEYVLGNLSSNRIYDWQADDYKVSAIAQSYFVNFIKSGNPNGLGLPTWQPVKKGENASVMNIDVDTHQYKETHRDRYLLLDKMNK